MFHKFLPQYITMGVMPEATDIVLYGCSDTVPITQIFKVVWQ